MTKLPKDQKNNFCSLLPGVNAFTNSGLPDGLFSNQKSQFWYILEGLGMGNVGIFYDHL
jgi:hypothetical protein